MDINNVSLIISIIIGIFTIISVISGIIIFILSSIFQKKNECQNDLTSLEQKFTNLLKYKVDEERVTRIEKNLDDLNKKFDTVITEISDCKGGISFIRGFLEKDETE